MSDKREGTEAAPGSLQRILADLEAADEKLGHVSAGRESTAEIEEARALLRSAVSALTRPAAAETGTGKQRVKIKAESEVASTTASSDAGATTPAKAAISSAKSPARGGRSQDAARTGRRPEPADKPQSTGSLLARLGAATAESPGPVPANTEIPAAVEAAKPVKAGASLSETAERLAQLEAEIADLTEAVTATPKSLSAREVELTSATAPAVPAAATRTATPAKSDDLDIDGDDESAEITIIDADGTRSEATTDAERQAPMVFRGAPPPYEEEAEVEIRGSQASARGAERAGTVRISARTSNGGSKGGALGKWRLFRGS